MCLYYLFYVGNSILISTFVAESYAPVDHNHEACKPKNCGSGPNISYPFYIYDTEIGFCGYPSFGIFVKKISFSLEYPEVITSLKMSFMRSNHFGWSTSKWLTPLVLPLNNFFFLAFDASSIGFSPSLLILFYFIIAPNGYLFFTQILQSLVLPLPQIILLPF